MDCCLRMQTAIFYVSIRLQPCFCCIYDIMDLNGNGGSEERLSADAFELVSLGTRYWFVLLGLIIVLRAARWAWHDHRSYLHTLRSLPDAGYIGEIVNLDTGVTQALPREGVMGSGKACDIRFKGLRRRELLYELREGKGILLTPSHENNQILMEDVPLSRHDYALHGTRLSFPGYSLRMRLFEGFDIPKREVTSMQEDAGYLQSSGDFNLEDYASESSYQQMPMIPPAMASRPTQDQVQQAEDPIGQMTWVYASPPADQQPDIPQLWADASNDDVNEAFIPQAPEAERITESHVRRRRSQRHEK